MHSWHRAVPGQVREWVDRSHSSVAGTETQGKRVRLELVAHKAVCAIRDKLSNAPVLRYYDVGKYVTIQADTSQTGLGLRSCRKASRYVMQGEP